MRALRAKYRAPSDRSLTEKQTRVGPDNEGELLPEYLRRYYAWTYVWPVSVWFFDHQPVISAILFGYYSRILHHTLRLMDPASAGRTLQIGAVYGKLTTTLAEDVDDLHVADAADIQLKATRGKLAANGHSAQFAPMWAEHLHYEANTFDTALMFLLLHEMPPQARWQALCEVIRTLRPGGRLVIAEYGELGQRHPFHRIAPMRWVLRRMEPFLDSFWHERLDGTVKACAANVGKGVTLEEEVPIFGGFYRVVRYHITPAEA